MRHLVVDEAALQQCCDANSEALSDIRRFCAEHGYHLHLIENGDAPRILHDDLQNDLYVSSTTITPVRANESCECSTPFCIRDAVLSSLGTDDEINVLLKDPRNECLANYADRIFVTGELLRYCTQRNIPHHPVWLWFDCSRLLAAQAGQSKEIERRQARLYRMEASKTE